MQISSVMREIGASLLLDFRNITLQEKLRLGKYGTPTFEDDGLHLASGEAVYIKDGDPTIFGGSIYQGVTYLIDMVPGFAPDSGATRILFSGYKSSILLYSVYLSSGNDLVVNYGGLSRFVSYATWSPYWSNDQNIIIVTINDGDLNCYLNGTNIMSLSISTWTHEQIDQLVIGSYYNYSTAYAPGVYRRLEIYKNFCSEDDVELLTNKGLLSDISFDRSLITLPTEYDYNDGSYQITSVIGKSLVTQALLGSDGITSAEFPEKISHRRIGYAFDGSRQFNLIDSDLFTFSDGVSDQPFSFAALVKFTDLSIGGCIMSKALSSTDGEYLIYFAGSGTGQIIVILIDDDLNGYIGKYTTIGEQYKYLFPVIVTYDGSGSSGIKIYVDGVSKALTSISSGSYTRMRNTSNTLKFGKAVTGLASNLRGELALPIIYDFVLSPLQCKILSRKLIGESSR